MDIVAIISIVFPCLAGVWIVISHFDKKIDKLIEKDERMNKTIADNRLLSQKKESDLYQIIDRQQQEIKHLQRSLVKEKSKNTSS